MRSTLALSAATALLVALAVPAFAQKAYQDRPTDTYDQPVKVPGGPVPTVYVSNPLSYIGVIDLRSVIQNATNIADEGLKQCNKQLFDDGIKSLRYYLNTLLDEQKRLEQDIEVSRARWVGGGLDPADFKPPASDTEQIQELTDDANTVASIINWLQARQNWTKCAPPEHAMVVPPPSTTPVVFATPALGLAAYPGAPYYNTPLGPVGGGWYVGVSGGPSFVPTINATEFFSDGRDRFPWGSSTGFYVGAQAGWENDHWRFEGQYTWSRNPAAATMPLPPDTKLGGDTETFGFFGNAIFTPPFTFPYPVTPHIGVGFGALNVTTTIKVNDLKVFDSSGWAPGAQAIGGLRYQISSRVSFDLDYRYQTTLSDVDYRALNTGNRVTAPYYSHSVVGSLTFHFNPPPPAPPPGGALPQAQQFASLAAHDTATAPVAVTHISATGPEPQRFTLRYDTADAALTPKSVRALHDALDAVAAGQEVRIAIAGCDRDAADDADGSPCARHALRLRHQLARHGVADPGRLLARG